MHRVPTDTCSRCAEEIGSTEPFVRSQYGRQEWCLPCWTFGLQRSHWDRPEFVNVVRIQVPLTAGKKRTYSIRHYSHLGILVAFHHARVAQTLVIEPWMRPSFAVHRLIERLRKEDRELTTAATSKSPLPLPHAGVPARSG